MDPVSPMSLILSLSGQGLAIAPQTVGSLGSSASFSEILSSIVGMPMGAPGTPWAAFAAECSEVLKQIRPEALKVSVFPRAQGSKDGIVRVARDRSTNSSDPTGTAAQLFLMFAAPVIDPALISCDGVSEPSVQPVKRGLEPSAFPGPVEPSLLQVESLVQQVESLIDRGESIVQQVESLIGETDKILTPSRFSAPEESGIRFPLTPELINAIQGGTEDTGAITNVLLPGGSTSFQVPVRVVVATDSNSSLEVRLGSVREENRNAAGMVSPTSDAVAEAPGLPTNVQAVVLVIQATPDVLSPALNQMSLRTEAVRTAADSAATVPGVDVNAPDLATSIPGTLWVLGKPADDSRNGADLTAELIQADPDVIKKMSSALLDAFRTEGTTSNDVLPGPGTIPVATDALQNPLNLEGSKPDMGQPVMNPVETADDTNQEILKTVRLTSQTDPTERVMIAAMDDTLGESGPVSIQARSGVLQRMTHAVRTALNRVTANPVFVQTGPEGVPAKVESVQSLIRPADSKLNAVQPLLDVPPLTSDLAEAGSTGIHRASATAREPLPVVTSLLSSAEGNIEIEIRTVGPEVIKLPPGTLVAWQAHLEADSDRQFWVTWGPIQGIGLEPALETPTPLEFSRTAEMLASRDYGSQIRGLVISSSQPTNAAEVQVMTETKAQPLGPENVFPEKAAVLSENLPTIPARSNLPETGITAPIKPSENPFVKTSVFEKQTSPAGEAIEVAMNPPKAANDRLRSVSEQPVEVTQPAFASLGKADGSDSTVLAHRAIEEGRSIERMVRNFRVLSEKGGGTVQIRLSPPSLGEVRIRVEVIEQSVRAVIETTSDAAKQLIERNLEDFSKGLVRRGLELSSLTVKSASEGGRSDGFRFSSGQGQNQNLFNSSDQAGQGRHQTGPGYENPETVSPNEFTPVEDEPEPPAQRPYQRVSRYEFVA